MVGAMSEYDLESEIAEVAEQAESATGDFGSYKNQDLEKLIKADRYLRSRDAQKDGRLGIKFFKIKPPGSA